MVQAASRAFASASDYLKPQPYLKPKPHAQPDPQPVSSNVKGIRDPRPMPAEQIKPIRDPRPMPPERIKPIRDSHPMPPVQIKKCHHHKPMPWEQIKPKNDPKPMPAEQIKPCDIVPVGPPIKVDTPPDPAWDQAYPAGTGGIKPIRYYAGGCSCAADLYTAADVYSGSSAADVTQDWVKLEA